MMCAIMRTDDLEATLYSSNGVEDLIASTPLAILLADFDDVLREGLSMAVTVDVNDDVVMMELLDFNGGAYYKPLPSKLLCYNTMKAYCDAYGVGMAIPEYVGPYTLEAARLAYEGCGDYMIIMPLMEEDEVCCAS